MLKTAAATHVITTKNLKKAIVYFPIVACQGASADATATLTATFDSARTANSAPFFGGAVDASRTWTPDISPDLFTAGTEQEATGPAWETRVEYFIGGTEPTPTWGIVTNAAWGAIAVEVKVAGATVTPRGPLLGILP